MWQLNLPFYQFRIKNFEGKNLIFDKYRKKFVQLTPEEWVRQNVLCYLTNELAYPVHLIAVEKQVVIAGKKLRFDSLIYTLSGEAKVLIEFKAPQVEITQEVFDQAAVYNQKLKVPYFLISNGLQHYFCRLDFEKNQYEFSEKIPFYSEI